MLCNSELAFLNRKNECKRAGRGGGQIQFFSPRLQLYLAQSVHVIGSLCRLQVNSLSSRGRRGTKRWQGEPQGSAAAREPGGRGAALPRVCPSRPAGRRHHLVPSATPPDPDTDTADGSASAFFSTFQKQTRCLKKETFELF